VRSGHLSDEPARSCTGATNHRGQPNDLWSSRGGALELRAKLPAAGAQFG